MFRRKGDKLAALLAHPGGPFFARKDDGVWTIPKGEALPAKIRLCVLKLNLKKKSGSDRQAIGSSLAQ